MLSAPCILESVHQYLHLHVVYVVITVVYRRSLSAPNVTSVFPICCPYIHRLLQRETHTHGHLSGVTSSDHVVPGHGTRALAECLTVTLRCLSVVPMATTIHLLGMVNDHLPKGHQRGEDCWRPVVVIQG